MCSRFSLAEDNDFLAARLGVSAMALANYRPRYNIAPQQEHFIVTTEYENRQLAPAKWGLVSSPGEGGRAMYSINARAETVESRPPLPGAALAKPDCSRVAPSAAARYEPCTRRGRIPYGFQGINRQKGNKPRSCVSSET